MYLDICFHVFKDIEDRHLVQFFMEYECRFLAKEPHSDDDKVRISKFIASAKLMCEILEQIVGNKLRDTRRQNKWMTLSSPAYFVYKFVM